MAKRTTMIPGPDGGAFGTPRMGAGEQRTRASFGNQRPAVNFAPDLPGELRVHAPFRRMAERFAALAASPENERRMKAVVPEMEVQDITADKAADWRRFMERAGQAARLTERADEIDP